MAAPDVFQQTAFHGRDYEWMFASCAMREPEFIRKEYAWLSPEYFLNSSVRKYWTLLLEGKTPVEAANEVGPKFAYDLLGYGERALLGSERDYANQIQQTHYLWKVSSQVQKIAVAAAGRDVPQVRQLSAELSNYETGGRVLGRSAEDVTADFLEVLARPAGRSIKTYITPIDTATGGLERDTLTVLAARPGVGKTALVLQVALNAARQGQRVHFFSLEMSAARLWARAACGRVGVRWRDVRDGRVSAEVREKVRAAALTIRDEVGENLIIHDKRTTTHGIWHELALTEPDLVVIDHLRKIANRGDNQVTLFGNMTSHLAAAAVQFGCAVILVHQLSRAVDGRQDKTPELADLRGSGEIEEDADNVMFLYRPAYYDRGALSPVQDTDLIISKFRDDVGNQLVKLSFDLSRQWFRGRME